MRVIPPLEITPARLTSTSAVELYPDYSTTPNYPLGYIVLDPATKDAYESVISENLNYPLDNSANWLIIEKSAVDPVLDMFTGNAVDGVIVTNMVLGNGQIFATNSPVRLGYLFNYTYLPTLDHPDKRYIVQYISNPTTPPEAYVDMKFIVLGVTYRKYSSIITYALNSFVCFPDRQICKSLTPNNYNKSNTAINAWQKIGVSNKVAMFDYTGNQRTVAPSPLTVTLTPAKRIDSIDLSGLANVKTVRIQMASGATTVYDKTINMVKRNVMNYYDWFFQPFKYKKSVVKFDLPPYTNGVITVNLTSASGNVECGSLIIGSQFYMGETQYNAKRDYNNYSTVTRNFDGSINTLVQRPAIPKMSQTLFIDKALAQPIADFLLSVDATPIVISGIDDEKDGYFEPLHAVGFIKSAPIDMAYPNHALLSLEIESISSN